MRKRTSLWGYKEMAESNLMFMPMIKLLQKFAESFEGRFNKTKAMTQCLIDEMPNYLIKLPVMNEVLSNVC